MSNDELEGNSQEENTKQVIAFLESQHTGVLCTTGTDGKPYGSVVYFSASKDSIVTFTTKNQTTKSRNMEQVGDVMLVVFDAEKQITLQLSGRAESVDDATQAAEILHDTVDISLDTSGRTIPPVAKLVAGDFIAYKISPESIKMAIFNSAEYMTYKEQFITIRKEDLENLKTAVY